MAYFVTVAVDHIGGPKYVQLRFQMVVRQAPVTPMTPLAGMTPVTPVTPVTGVSEEEEVRAGAVEG